MDMKTDPKNTIHSIATQQTARMTTKEIFALCDIVRQTGFEIHRYQPLLFYVESFEHLYSLVDDLEKWMRAGKLNNVVPGEPLVSAEDIASFMEGT